MTFETQVVPAAPEAHVTPLLNVVVPQGGQPASLAALDQASQGAITRCYAAGDFAGKKDETALLYPEGSRPRILLIGIGTTNPAKKVEINSADGTNLRLTYNDPDGSAINYADLEVTPTGDLNITPSGGDVAVVGNLSATNLSGTNTGDGAPADAEYITSSAASGLSAERVLTDTGTVTWDFATPGQAKANASAAPAPDNDARFLALAAM